MLKDLDRAATEVGAFSVAGESVEDHPGRRDAPHPTVPDPTTCADALFTLMAGIEKRKNRKPSNSMTSQPIGLKGFGSIVIGNAFHNALQSLT